MLNQHLARYHFAKSYIQDKQVLDFGCGEGFGSQVLLTETGTLTALDIDRIAVKATLKKIIKNVVLADGRTAPFKEKSFDIVVSFEVFEHISDIHSYLKEVGRILRNGGKYIMSTPNIDYYPLAGLNPYHFKEYRVEEVYKSLADAGLEIETIFAQVTADPLIEKIHSSKLLLIIMKFKRILGLHRDLLPRFLQNVVHKIIAHSKELKFNPNQYKFIENVTNSPELIYIARKL